MAILLKFFPCAQNLIALVSLPDADALKKVAGYFA